jgi:GNAT superfamily N-acetyltransferase
MIAFEKAMNYTHSTYWETMFPQNYYLALLATHPHYRRRGAGTALTQWGIDQALAAGIDVGLEASPMGFPLYQHLGFILLEDLVVKPDNDPASVLLRIMVHDKNRKSFLVRFINIVRRIGIALRQIHVGFPSCQSIKFGINQQLLYPTTLV